MKPYSFTFAIALILTFTVLVQASCSGCSERAVPISPSGIAGGNTTIYNTYNYYNSTYWYESGGWLYQNLTTAPNGINVSTVNTSQICISGNCQTTWPGGSGFLNSTWFEQNGWLVNNLTTAASGVNVTGANGNTYLTGNNIDMDRDGPNYIQSTNVTGSLYLGAGGVTGIIGMIAGASINSIYINGDALYLGADGVAGIIAIYDGGLKDSIVINENGTGINNTNPQHALDVNGSVYANVNVSAPLLNASCIILDNERVCNWTAINGSLGSGTFNETEGVYIYNDTSYEVKFNATLLNYTIDARVPVESDPEWEGNETRVSELEASNASVWVNLSTGSGLYVPYTGATQNVDLGAHDFTVDTDTLFVDESTNRVGIGTSNPQSALNVYGLSPVVNITGNYSHGQKAFQIFDELGGHEMFYILKYLNSPGYVMVGGPFWIQWNIAQSTFNNPAGGVYFQLSGKVGATHRFSTWKGELRFETRQGAYAISFAPYEIEAMRITGARDVGIGTRVPYAKLHVNGSLLANGTINATTDVCIVGGNCLSSTLTMAYQSAARAYNSSNTSTINGVAEKVTFNLESFDIQSEFANSRFTATQAGIYSIDTQIVYPAAGTSKVLQIRKNGAVHKETITDALSSSLDATDLVQLAATDYIEIWAYGKAGAFTVYGGSENMTVTIMKVA